MQENSLMAEALLPLHSHWYISYALVVTGLFLSGALSVRLFRATPSLLSVLNGSLLLVLLLTGGNSFYDLFIEQDRTWLLHPNFWDTSLGKFYILLYHNIGMLVGLLLFWSYFRKNVFFSFLMAALINIHALVDAALAIDWWMIHLSDVRLGYELSSYLAVRPAPSLLIREWSLFLVLAGILVQVAILVGYSFYLTNRRST